MDRVRFDYSTKNIPIPSPNTYISKIIEKTEEFIRRMRWKAYFYLNPNATQNRKQTFGFKSKNSPPAIEELKKFEEIMLRLVSNITFKQQPKPSDFQTKLSHDINNKIKSSTDVLIKGDKTNHFYCMNPDDYKKLLRENVTNIAVNIEKRSKIITEKLGLDDRIETRAKKEPFITIKDHKPNFNTNPKYRLIKPTKAEIGKNKQMHP